jgi:hypothetical protein
MISPLLGALLFMSEGITLMAAIGGKLLMHLINIYT